jgi:hypothetical protein
MKSNSLEGILHTTDIIFQEVAHTYTKPDGTLYTGCTTISDAWDKSFFLGPWYAKEMASDLLSKPFEVMTENPKMFELAVMAAKGAAKRKSEQAKSDGTAAHDWISAVVQSKMGSDKPLPPTPQSKEADNAVTAFVGWMKDKDITWLASEEVVASDEHRVAGKLDGIAVIDGITYLVDFKTSGQLSASYLLQCAGYDLMLREMGLQVMGYLIIRIPKDGKEAETLTITNQTDMQFFRETFLHQRVAHKFYSYMESKFKDMGSRKMKVDAKPIVQPIKAVKPKSVTNAATSKAA